MLKGRKEIPPGYNLSSFDKSCFGRHGQYGSKIQHFRYKNSRAAVWSTVDIVLLCMVQ